MDLLMESSVARTSRLLPNFMNVNLLVLFHAPALDYPVRWFFGQCFIACVIPHLTIRQGLEVQESVIKGESYILKFIPLVMSSTYHATCYWLPKASL